MTNTKTTFAIAFLAISLALALGSVDDAFAVPVPINLPGFESPNLGNGKWTPTYAANPTEWQFYGTAGVFNPKTQHITNEAPEGKNTAYTNNGYLCQDLDTKVQGEIKYTLSVQVGTRNEGLPNQFHLFLFDQSFTVLAHLPYTEGIVPPRGQWAENTIERTVYDGDPSIGKNLKICLYSPRAQSNFDDVRLDATPLYGSIAGQKYEDLNGDGLRDSGEPYLNGWTIFLDENDNAELDPGELRTVTQDIRGIPGNYLFEEVPLGHYHICEIMQYNWAQTAPGSPAEPECFDVTLESGYREITGLNFGNEVLGEIHGQKYADQNLNGIRDHGEPYLNGWTIYIDENFNRVLDDGEYSTVTHENDAGKIGVYKFTGLIEGHYDVCEVIPDEWEQTQPGSAHDPACYEVDIDYSGKKVKGLDFGNFNYNLYGATLTVIKNVINNNGGTAAPEDFVMNVTNPLFVPFTTFAGSAQGVEIAIAAGQTIVTENELPLYNSSMDGDCNFVAQLGVEYVCTITNNDKAPGLTLIKNVINDNGGIAVPGNFTMTATGPTTISGPGPIVESDESFVAGEYTLSETELFGYESGEWSCVGDGIQVDNTITLGLDDSTTCTIINDDVAPTLTVIKNVINNNGGSAVPADFTMIVTNSLFEPQTTFAGSSEGTTIPIDAGYTAVSEAKPISYMSDGGEGDCEFIAESGMDYTCTITNDDLAPGLTLEMNLIQDDNGFAHASEFTLSANGTTPFSGPGPLVQSGENIVAGIYSLDATGSEYYTYSDWTCSASQIDSTTVSLPFGAAVLCSITIDDKLDSDGDAIPNEFDNCKDVPNFEQLDWNEDGIGDACAPSGGDNEWDTRPTFGVNHEDYQSMIVDNGFAFNGNTFSVTDNHHTPFEQQIIEIGAVNTFAATVYADKDLKVQEFLFGVPEVGMGHLAEMRVEVWYDNVGDIADIKVIQDTEVIDRSTLSVTHKTSKCLSSDTEENCNTTTMSAVFLEPLADSVMAIKAIDFALRDQTTYLNDGFDISGDSLNPMKTMMIPSTIKGEGLIQVTQNEKYSDYWSAQDGRIFEMNSFGSFKQINLAFERFSDSGNALTRLHSNFGKIVEYEANRAVGVFDASKLVSELPASFSHDIIISDRLSEEVIAEMIIQQHIAQKVLESMDQQSRWN
ncbi:MAG: hypothetical protein OEL77_05395 [Nitrosopumilus sp.]|nr:hypothetical protein [Nitrosopumilus sp.]